MRHMLAKLLCALLALGLLAGMAPAAAAEDTEAPELPEAQTAPAEPETEATAGPAQSAEEADAESDVSAAAAETGSGDTEEGSVLPGTGTADDPYLIRNAADMQALDDAVENGETYAGAYFLMTADIQLPSSFDGLGYGAGLAGEVASVTADCRPFGGDFDGGGFTLSVAEGGVSPFDFVSGAVIHGLAVYGLRIEGCGILNTYVSDMGEVTFRSVTLKSGTQTLKSGFVGGYGNSAVTIDGCTVEPGVVIGYAKDQKWIGSFGGEFNGTIRNSRSDASVYGTDFVGGIAGDKGQSMQTFEIINCTFGGEVTAMGDYAGGIVGAGYAGTRWGMASAWACRGVTVKSCTMSGSVTGNRGVGGILGGEGAQVQAWDNGPSYIQNNDVTGKVSGKEHVGAVIGYLMSLNKNNYVSGNTYLTDCGPEKGIGAVGGVDTSGREAGTFEGTFYFSTSTADGKTAAEIRDEVPGHALESTLTLTSFGSSGYKSQFKVDHNRTDDPLGADAESLCRPVEPENPDGPEDPDTPPEPEEPKPVDLAVSGNYRKTYTVGDSLDTSGMVFTVTWSDGTETQADLSEITLTGFDSTKAGECSVSAAYGTLSTAFILTIEPASVKIHVTVAVYGDYRHDSESDGKVHGLSMGGLSTWVARSSWEADEKETVWDVLQRVFAARGIRALTRGSGSSVYLAGMVYNGTSLSEFDNGVNSGWMYTVNGAHPESGIGQRYVKDGDSIVVHYSDDYTKEEGSGKYNDDETDSAAENVEALIRAIGSPVTEASRTAVEKARKAYDALSYAQKSKVGNYAVLTAAEQALKDLKKAVDEKAAGEVRKLIGTIPAELTGKDRQAVEKARAAYDALTEEQKALVTNYSRLAEAERLLAEAEATEKDRKAAEEVRDLIDAIGKAIPEEKEQAIAAAREAYDALTDLQKKLVDNYGDLEEAEKALAAVKAAEKYRSAYETTGDYLESLGTPVTGAVGGEWAVIGLTRSGRTVEDTEAYLASAARYIEENIDGQGRLHRAKSSDNSRMILALTALGQDPADFAGHDLLAGLTDMAYVTKQGINGPSWALIALDSGNYEVPEDPSAGDPVTREKLIACLLDAQLEDGGWALSGDMADSDITGMVLQALAPYYGKIDAVTEAVDRALDTVSRMQNADGTFSTFGSGEGMQPTSESISQILVALSALGIDAGKDERFIKNGVSALDALLAFYVDGGGFRHVPDGERDGLATEQAYYALTAYFRMLEGKTALYDMTDILPERAPAPAAEEPEEDGADRRPEEEYTYEDAPTAAETAGREDGKRSPAFLYWGIPAVAAIGAAAFLIDRKRRTSKKQ